MNNPTYQYIYQVDSLAHLQEMQDASFDLIVTDPPYFGVLSKKAHGVDADWDNIWKNEADFMKWMGAYLDEFKRLLKPNGAMYLFCSSKQQAKMEMATAERFDIINSIVWFKENHGLARKSKKAELRSYVTQKEHLIFCESKNADMWAYNGMDTEHGFLFEPVRKYLADAWFGSGYTTKDLNLLLNNFMAGHYLSQSQFSIPPLKSYELMQSKCHNLTTGYNELYKTYAELQEEYKALKEKYNQRRRTFQLTNDTEWTDVWTYKPPKSGDRHVCEKPLEMMMDIIKASSKPGDRVLDAFSGSAVVGDACKQLGRNFVGIEQQLSWAVRGTNRIQGRDVFIDERDVAAIQGAQVYASSGGQH